MSLIGQNYVQLICISSFLPYIEPASYIALHVFGLARTMYISFVFRTSCIPTPRLASHLVVQHLNSLQSITKSYLLHSISSFPLCSIPTPRPASHLVQHLNTLQSISKSFLLHSISSFPLRSIPPPRPASQLVVQHLNLLQSISKVVVHVIHRFSTRRTAS